MNPIKIQIIRTVNPIKIQLSNYFRFGHFTLFLVGGGGLNLPNAKTKQIGSKIGTAEILHQEAYQAQGVKVTSEPN